VIAGRLSGSLPEKALKSQAFSLSDNGDNQMFKEKEKQHHSPARIIGKVFCPSLPDFVVRHL